MNFLNPMLMCDFYKLAHREMYPKGTEVVYSTWTPRASRMPGINEVVVFGLQAFIQEYLINFFDTEFFNADKRTVCQEYKDVVSATLGTPDPDTSHIEALWYLGYLPLEIKALPEGSVVPLRTPVMTIKNTHPDFFWLTNYIETLASAQLWKASTSATIARQYRLLFNEYAKLTGGDSDFVKFQGHDFSMRGMSCVESAVLSGMGHLLSFVGTDTIPAIQGAAYYYNADLSSELVGTSIPASEHSVQCAYGNDMEYLRNMISVVHPNGYVSIVSDGYDFWDVVGRILPALKNEIMSRSGGPIGDKVVIRPDSGDPVLIVCGDPEADDPLVRAGAVEALWNTFGGTINAQGYKQLDPHIGLIYGDAITLTRAEEILKRLADKGFASTNVVFGIGSYTYQYNTRDTFGYALKSTMCVINGEEVPIFKDPKTDDGIKKSQKGIVKVYETSTGGYSWCDGLYMRDYDNKDDAMKAVFRNSCIYNDITFENVRKNLWS